MKKYLHLLKYEMKTLFKDSFSMFTIIYPLVMLLIAGLIVPTAIKDDTNPQTAAVILLVVLTVAFAVGAFVAGAMLAFLIIENKDEKTILSISVTPIEVKGYIWFKMVYTYVMSLCSNFIIIAGLKWFANDAYTIEYGGVTIALLENISWGHILAFIFVNSMIVPSVALLIAALSKNKIEGFAFVKSSGIFIMIPILSFIPYFQDWKQYLLGIMPNFWPIKAILNVALGNFGQNNLPFVWYLVIGASYFILIAFASLKLFMKKANLN